MTRRRQRAIQALPPELGNSLLNGRPTRRIHFVSLWKRSKRVVASMGIMTHRWAAMEAMNVYSTFCAVCLALVLFSVCQRGSTQ